MTRKHTSKHYRHLTPLEIRAIGSALQEGAWVPTIAEQYHVCRQTIYNVKNTLPRDASDGNDPASVPAKRRRNRGIPPELKDAVIQLRKKYPTWGAPCIREEVRKQKLPRISVSAIYKILRDTGLNGRGKPAKIFQRFTMMKPGQLYQMDIQGKIWLPNLGWIYGHAVLDDYSRYCLAFVYLSDEKADNTILVLQRAIDAAGIPDAIYVDNGKQFRSASARMNNFELLCSSLAIKVISTKPYHPEGKGKIERFFETIERQFIPVARAKAEADPTYTLERLNTDLQEFLETTYHVRTHTTTKRTPRDMFVERDLRHPMQPISITAFLEHRESRQVNRHGEISYDGFKIQLDLPLSSEVTVIETIETLALEFRGQVIRTIEKRALQKAAPVNRQDGVSPLKDEPTSPGKHEKGIPTVTKSFLEGSKGRAPRRVSPKGTFTYNAVQYQLGEAWAGQRVFVTADHEVLHVFDAGQNFITSLPVNGGASPKSPSPAKLSYMRRVKADGRFRVEGKVYYLKREWAGKEVVISRDGDHYDVHDGARNLVATFPGFYKLQVNRNGEFYLQGRTYVLGDRWKGATIRVDTTRYHVRVYTLDGDFLQVIPIREGRSAPLASKGTPRERG